MDRGGSARSQRLTVSLTRADQTEGHCHHRPWAARYTDGILHIMSNPTVTIYRTAWCPYCQRAEALLASKSIPSLDTIDVDVVAGARATMVERTGRTSVPQIFIGDTHVGGCDDLMALERAGKLDALLAG